MNKINLLIGKEVRTCIRVEIKTFLDELEVPKNKIWIMPPGDNRQELIRVYPMVIQWCTDNYYNFTGREHIIAFDTKREV